MIGLAGRARRTRPPDNFGQTVNGNYAFASRLRPRALDDRGRPAGGASASPRRRPPSASDALAADAVAADHGRRLRGQGRHPDACPTASRSTRPTQEEDVNVFDGDARMPQENFPLTRRPTPQPAATDVGPRCTAARSRRATASSSPCAGANHPVHVTDRRLPRRAAAARSRARTRPLCDAKLITSAASQAVAPNFNLFTEVPLPTHFWGLTINDLGLSHDKTQLGYGEAQPLPNVPDGHLRLVRPARRHGHDRLQRHVRGASSRRRPRTTARCRPGPCPGMYYFKGNDPGQPGHVNANYNPRFRTIGTELPGLARTVHRD